MKKNEVLPLDEDNVIELTEDDVFEAVSIAEADRPALEKYIKRYEQGKRRKTGRILLIALTVVLFLGGVALIASIGSDLYILNQTLGLSVFIGLGIAFLAFFVYFCIRIYSLPVFHNQYHVDGTTAKKNRLHNKRMVKKIATHVYEIYEGAQLKIRPEEEEQYKQLGLALKEKGKKGEALTQSLMKSLLKKNGALHRQALALSSQSFLKAGLGGFAGSNNAPLINAGIVLTTNLSLIRSIVYLYGYRPNDVQLSYLYSKVLFNTCLAMGASAVLKGESFASLFTRVGASLPGQIISGILSAATQAILNGTLTYMVGKKTIEFLLEEYQMQSLLRIQEAELTEICFGEEEQKAILSLRKEEKKGLASKIKALFQRKEKQPEPELLRLEKKD